MRAMAAGNEKFLSDLKYLMQEMEKSFLQINHARRKFGVDIRAQATRLADRISAAQDTYSTHEFHGLLREYIFTPEVQRAGSRSWYSMTSNVDALSKDFYLEFFLRTSESSAGSYDDHLHRMLN